MEKIKTWGIAAVIFYFFINALADNPREVAKFRSQMNSFVVTTYKKVKRAL
jgi:hypothetical protein